LSQSDWPHSDGLSGFIIDDLNDHIAWYFDRRASCFSYSFLSYTESDFAATG
jgi:hypothetical protein